MSASSTHTPFLLKIAKIPSSLDGLSMLIGHENKTDTKDDIMVKNDCSVLYGFGPLFSTDRL
jgi:hypothetical protein